MRGQVAPIRMVDSNAQTTLADVSDTIALITFTILFPLTLLAIVTRRKHRQRLTQERIGHLERSWRLKPSHTSH